ncbi:unnamed protein product [Clonostachys rhizophaga]|uniref:Uncharacterized protein n=1 Tax=Clonostachys rhizophaga TaxID=160324 RepID=A0A9N9VW39_9HYPO|nr:unnamed protein product [Clonostachys rhizophaga]
MKTKGTRDLESSLKWPLRPILTSLNGDNSWLFSFPRPTNDGHNQYFYHIAFEPWLVGPTAGLPEWLAFITLSQEPAIASGDAVQNAATEIERIAAELARTNGSGVRAAQNKGIDEYSGAVDAIVILFDGPDHCHRPTLETFDKRIPLVASKEAAAVVKAWNYFDDVSTIHEPDMSAETWQADKPHSSPLPSWLTTFKLSGEGFLNFVGVFIWSQTLDTGEQVHEVILDSPHGTETSDLEDSPIQNFLRMAPAITPLAILHGLKESFATRWWRTTHGAEAGLKLYRKSGSKYWILSHDLELEYSGLMLRALVFDIRRTLDWALSREKGATEAEDVNFVDVGNGNSFVLV